MSRGCNAFDASGTPVLLPFKAGPGGNRRGVLPPPRAPRARLAGPPPRQDHYAEGRGLFRIFNPAEFRLYWSSSGPPAEGSTPQATSASLPYATPPLADGTWYFSLSWFNGVLDSGFLPLGPAGEPYLVLRIVDGAVVANPPSAPFWGELRPDAGGVLGILALYDEAIASLRADQWAIAYTSDGTAPDPDDPGITAAVDGDGRAILDYALPAQAAGTLVRVCLQVRRNDGTGETPDWTYSDPLYLSATVAIAAPVAPPAAVAWPGLTP
jgi:hypothetical protein